MATRLRPSRVMGILEGAREAYAADLSLVGQGAVVRAACDVAPRFAITPLGRRAATVAAEESGFELP